MSETLIKVENVSKKFCRSLKRSLWYGLKDLSAELTGLNSKSKKALRDDEFWAVKDVSFELKRGECLGLIGRNGAGKSTLLRMLNGLIKPDTGMIEMKGRIGALIALGVGFNPVLSGRENIYVNSAVLGVSKREVDEIFDEIVEFSELEEFIDAPVQSYSSGMVVRLGFAVTTALKPDILIIDEVLAVGDIGFRIKCINRIKGLLESTSVIFVSHIMQHISSICTKIMLMDKGNKELLTSDISLGVDKYFDHIENQFESIINHPDINISNINLQKTDNCEKENKRLLINHNGDIWVKMQLQINNPYIRNIAVKVLLWDTQMRCIVDCNSAFCNFKILPYKKSTVRLKLEKITLNTGNYSVSITVLNLDDNQVLARYDNTAHLQVSSRYTSWASVNMVGEWHQNQLI